MKLFLLIMVLMFGIVSYATPNLHKGWEYFDNQGWWFVIRDVDGTFVDKARGNFEIWANQKYPVWVVRDHEYTHELIYQNGQFLTWLPCEVKRYKIPNQVHEKWCHYVDPISKKFIRREPIRYPLLE
jgi:hypothetical protein